MKKLSEKLFWAIESLCKIALIIQIISVSIVVFGRQLFSKTPAWGEELTLFLMVWLSLVGAIVLLREGGHIAVTAFDPWIPGKVVKVLDFICYIFLGFYAVIMFIYGIKLMEITSLNVMPALKIRSSWLYAAVPASSIVMMLAVIEKIFMLFTKKEMERGV